MGYAVRIVKGFMLVFYLFLLFRLFHLLCSFCPSLRFEWYKYRMERDGLKLQLTEDDEKNEKVVFQIQQVQVSYDGAVQSIPLKNMRDIISAPVHL